MELNINKETMYGHLPTSVQSNSSKIGIQKVSKDFVKTFLKHTAHSDKKKEANVPLDHLMVVSEVIEKVPKKRKKVAVLRKHSKKLTNLERKKFKLVNLKTGNEKYKSYIPLHNLWKDHIKDLFASSIKDKSQAALHNDTLKLLKADLHGAILTVFKSSCPSYVHTTGIVLQETKNTFKLITKDNHIKCIPKMNSIFRLENSGVIYTIYGNHFKVKSSQRATRKFKSKGTIDI